VIVPGSGNPSPGIDPRNLGLICQFTLTLSPEVTLDFDQFSFDAHLGCFLGPCPTVFVTVVSSLDGFLTPVAVGSFKPLGATPFEGHIAVPVSAPAFQHLTAQGLTGGSVTFRLMLSRGTDGSEDSACTCDLDNFALSGTASLPVPALPRGFGELLVVSLAA